MQDAADKAHAAGIPRPIATAILMPIEAALVNALLVEQSRFVEACAINGTASLAKNEGITQRAIRKRRKKCQAELNRLAKFR